MNRRNFLQNSAIGLSAFGIPQLANCAEQAHNDKSILFLFLHGGASIVESFNPIMDMPAEFRSTIGDVKTNVPGIYLGGAFQKLANHADKMSICHNFKHRDANHGSAQHWVTTGHADFKLLEGQNQSEPCMGSLATKQYGDIGENLLPTYVKVNKGAHDNAAWLGSKYMGYQIDNDGVKNLQLSISPERFNRRLEIVNLIEERNKLKGQHLSKSWSDLRNLAADIMLGDAANTFDIAKCSNSDKVRYDVEKNNFGRNMLLARKSIEKGVKFTSVTHFGWDMHSDIANSFMRAGTEIDNYLSVFIEDLVRLNLLDKTLIVITSEFSRTRLTAAMGKDHNPNIVPLTFIGGTNNNGRIIGKSSKDSLSVDGKSYEPKDLLWTMGDFLGIDRKLVINDHLNRPRHIFDDSANNILRS